MTPRCNLLLEVILLNTLIFFKNPQVQEACTFSKAKTFGEIFIAKAYDSGGVHRWFYDAESLKHVMESAGFVDVQQVGRLEGSMPDREKIELAGREIETLYMEGRKV